MPLEALALARALRRNCREPRSVAFVGDVSPRFALRVVRRQARPEGGGTAYLVCVPAELAREVAPLFTEAGWSVRGLGLAAEDWLADAAGARVDALVARGVLQGRGEEARRALLDRAARKASCFVAWEPPGSVGEDGVTALWPAWHSCAMRERRLRGWGSLFEAVAL